jgi:lipoate-protein ligase A
MHQSIPQNPWREANLPLLRQHNIPLIRRKSGGGTVFHDIGNTNYTVFMPRSEFSRTKHLHMIVKALEMLDIPADVNARHDIIVRVPKRPSASDTVTSDSSEAGNDTGERKSEEFEEYKISGSAYKVVSDRAYHHGTMLIDSDLKGLGMFLKAPKVSPSNLIYIHERHYLTF